MSMNFTGFTSWNTSGVGQPQNLEGRLRPVSTDEFQARLAEYGGSSELVTAESVNKIFEDNEAATSNREPDAVWGTIVSGNTVLAEVFETGGIAYYGSDEVSIDTDAPPGEVAKQFMHKYGGHLVDSQSESDSILV